MPRPRGPKDVPRPPVLALITDSRREWGAAEPVERPPAPPVLQNEGRVMPMRHHREECMRAALELLKLSAESGFCDRAAEQIAEVLQREPRERECKAPFTKRSS